MSRKRSWIFWAVCVGLVVLWGDYGSSLYSETIVVDDDITDPVVITDTGTIFDVNANPSSPFYYTISGELSGYGPLTKTGLGTLYLSGINENFSGATIVDEGKLLLKHGVSINFDAANIVRGIGSELVSEQAIHVGNIGSGSLLIKDGATAMSNADTVLGITSTGWGSILVDGSGSSLTSDSNLVVGNQGTGYLTVRNGGEVVATSMDFSIGKEYISSSSFGRGTVTVEGTGSTLTAKNIAVGNSGNGTLLIYNGGVVKSTADFTVGKQAFSNGYVLLEGPNSHLESDAQIIVGDFNGGSMTVSGGGKATAYDAIIIGKDSNAGSVLTVTGGASLVSSGADIIVGHKGRGTLTVMDQGTVSATGSILISNLYNSTLGTGKANVIGTGATLDAGAQLLVGYEYNGSLFLSKGGMATAVGNVEIGGIINSNGRGTVVVGENSTLESGDTVNVHMYGFLGGTGTVSATNGVTVDSGATLSPGNYTGHVDTLNIDGDFQLSSATLRIDASNTVADKVSIDGTADVSNLTLNLTSLKAVSGIFTFLESTGTLTYNGTTEITLNGEAIPGTGRTAFMPPSVTQSGKQLQLLWVASTTAVNQHLTWTGAAGNNWNLTDQNWHDGTTDTTFLDGDAVTFNNLIDNVNIGGTGKTVSQIIFTGATTAANVSGSLLVDGSKANGLSPAYPGQLILDASLGTTGQVNLTHDNEFMGGVIAQGGVLATHSDKALGTYETNTTDPTKSKGQLTVTGTVRATGPLMSNRIVVESTGNLELMSREFENIHNEATNGLGGAIQVKNAGTLTLALPYLTISDSSATKGGGLYSEGTIGYVITPFDCRWTFSRNVATGDGSGGEGGALWLSKPVSISTGLFEQNQTFGVDSKGGAVFLQSATANAWKFGDVTFRKNRSVGYGGAMYINAADQDISILVTDRPETVGTLRFENNWASNTGGAVYANANLALRANTVFSGNIAEQSGGAIAMESDQELSIRGNTLFSNNYIGGGNGAAILAGKTVSLDPTAGDIVFTGNYRAVGFDTDGNPDSFFAAVSESIHLTSNSAIDFALTSTKNVYFDDPISSSSTGGASFRKRGTGFVQFVGTNVLQTGAGSTGGGVVLENGTFRLANATFLTQGTEALFTVTGSTATIAGFGKITAGQGFSIGGVISPDSDYFEAPEGIGSATPVAARTIVSENARIGNLTLEGNTSFNNTQFHIDLDGGSLSDTIDVTGTVTGTGRIVLGAGQENFGTYTILTASAGGIVANNFTVTGGPHTTGSLAASTANTLVLQTSFQNGELLWTGDNNSGTGVWNTVTSNTPWQGDEYFADKDVVTFDSSYSGTTTVQSGGVIVSGMNITGGSHVFSGADATSKISGTTTGVTGTDVTPTGKLNISGGTTTMNVETDFEKGATMSAGTLVLGHNKALGVYATNTTTPADSKGQLIVTGNSTVRILDDRTITNRFSAGAGTLTLDVTTGKTLTILGVNNTNTVDPNGFGGAIYAANNLTVTGNATFGGAGVGEGNAAKFGAGVFLNTTATTLTLNGNTLFQNNSATNLGGGVYFLSANANTINNTGTLTFKGNSAANTGGAVSSDGNLTISGSATFGGSGVGEGNTAAKGGAIGMSLVSATTLTHNGNTLYQNNTATDQGGAIYATTGLTLTNTNTLTFIGNQATGATGKGGAIYSTGNLVGGSDAIFGGTNATDGNSANQGGAIYLGSSATQLSLNGTTFQNNTATDMGGAVFMANTVTLMNTGNTAFTGNTTTNSGGAIYAANALTLTNNSGATLQFTGNEADTGGAIFAARALTLGNAGTTLFTANKARYGGALSSDRDFVIGSGVTFGGSVAAQGNHATVDGGVIYLHANASQVALDGTTFQNNTAAENGGAIYYLTNNANSLTNSNATRFMNNTAVNRGGALFANGPLTLTNAAGGTLTFTGNKATDVAGKGGAIYSAGNVTIGSGVTFGGDSAADGNSANQGGAIYLGSATTQLSLNGTVFQNNTATDSGGAIYLANATASTVANTGNTSFTGNNAAYLGGAIYATGNLTIGDAMTFTSNTAGIVGTDGSGGAIYAGGNITVGNNVVFDGNEVFGSIGNGGTIYMQGTSLTLGTNVIFRNNIASQGGGALYLNSSNPITINNAGPLYFENNQGNTAAGAISALGDLTLGTNTSFIGNSVQNYGGAITVFNGHSLTVRGNTLFKDNTAGQTGGAISTTTLNLLADTGNIAFTGNLARTLSSPVSYAIEFFTNAGNSLSIGGNYHVFLDDGMSGTVDSLTKSGSGFVQFASANISGFRAKKVDVQNGTFRIVNGGTLFVTGSASDKFTLSSSAILAGAGSISSTNGFTIQGTMTPDADRFEIPTYNNATNTFTAARTTIASGKEIGTLSLIGDVQFNAASLAVDLDASNASDKIDVTGSVSSLANNTINLGLWDVGTYEIMTATGGGIVAANYAVDSSSFGTRQRADLSGTANSLILTTSTTGNLDLVWTGSTDGNWNTTVAGNWTNGEKYNPNDYVTFTAAGVTKTVTVGNGTGVQVSGMKITGGDYTFNGNKITGTAPTSFGQTVTGKLELATTGTTTINVETDFVNGAELSAGTLILGNDRAIGVHDDRLLSKGLLTVSGAATIGATYDSSNNRTVKGAIDVTNTGDLTLDVAAGKTLIFDGIEGKAINLDDSSLTVTGTGNLVFQNGGNGSAFYTNRNTPISLDFSLLSSLTVSNNGRETPGMPNSDVPFYVMSGDDVNLTFGDNVTFSDNYVGSDWILPAGSLYVYSGTKATVALGDNAEFTQNHGMSGGLMVASEDVAISFGDNAKFTANSSESYGGMLIYGGSGTVEFGRNTVISANNGQMGAITFMNASGTNDAVDMKFGTGATVAGNRSYYDNSLRFGFGAGISTSGSVEFSGNTILRENQAERFGGAIYLGVPNDQFVFTPSLLLNATGGDIAMTGNKHGVTFDANHNPVTGTGTANSVYLQQNTAITISGTGNVFFDDPILAGKPGDWDNGGGNDTIIYGGNSLVKNGTGYVQFMGANVLNPQYEDEFSTPASGGSVTINSGTFRLAGTGASFAAKGTGAAFTIASTGSVAGQGTISAEQGFVVRGTLSPDGDRFEIPNGIGTATAEASRTIIDAGKEIGTLTFIGNVLLDSATLAIDLAASNVSDHINVTGNIAHGNTSTVKLSNAQAGSYVIVTATNGLNASSLVVDPNSLGTRQAASLSVSGNNLLLHVASTNKNLVWTGGADGNWDITAVGNWASGERFNPDDYVVFDATAVTKTVTITNASGVQVAGMEVDGGDYIFHGGGISSVLSTPNGQTVTGKLAVNAGTAVFNNELAFADGIEINDGSATFHNAVSGGNMTVGALGTAIIADGASFSNSMAISNAGHLRFHRSDSHTIVNDIYGTGNVEQNGTGLLTLAANTMQGTFVHSAGTVELAAGKTWSGNYLQENTAGTFLGGSSSGISGTASFTNEVSLDGTFHVGTLKLDGATLLIDLFSGNISDNIVSAAAATVSSTNMIRLPTWEVGAFTILTAPGGFDVTKFAVDPVHITTRRSATLSVDGDSLKLVTTSGGNFDMTWTGASNGNWDTTTAGNWAGNLLFDANDFVRFDANGVTQTVKVDANVGVQVSGMEIFGGHYTFEGGRILGVTPSSDGQTVTGKLVAFGGTTTLTNELDFVNGLEIDPAATIILGGKGTFADSMPLHNNGTLIFNQTGNYVQNGDITGWGDVIGRPLGMLTLTGNKTSTGNFIHENGAVYLAGSWNGNWIQSGGLMLADAGSRIGGDFTTSGTLDPIGVLSVNGNAHFDGAILEIALFDGNVSDRIDIGGHVTFGDRVNTLDIEHWTEGTYTVMSANSIAPIDGKWKILYAGAIVNSDSAQLFVDSNALKLQNTIAPVDDRLILEWDGNLNGDPQGQVWDSTTLKEGVYVIVDLPETALITLAEDTQDVSGMAFKVNTKIRPIRADQRQAKLVCKHNPELDFLRDNGKISVQEGVLDLQIGTAAEFGNVINNATVIVGHDEALGVFQQNFENLEHSAGQTIVEAGADARIETSTTVDTQNRLIVYGYCTIDPKTGERFVVRKVNVTSGPAVQTLQATEDTTESTDIAQSDSENMSLFAAASTMAVTATNSVFALPPSSPFNGGAIAMSPGSKLALIGEILVSENSTDKAGGAIYMNSSILHIDSSKGHTGFIDNHDETGLNSIALDGNDNLMSFTGEKNAVSGRTGGTVFGGSVRALAYSVGNSLEVAYDDAADFVQFGGSAPNSLNDPSASYYGTSNRLLAKSGTVRLVDGSSFDIGDSSLVDIYTDGVLAGNGNFIATNSTVRGTLRPDSASLTTTSSVIDRANQIAVLTLSGNVCLDGGTIGVELKANNVSDKVYIDGNLCYAADNFVNVNSWSDGTFTVLQTVNGAAAPVLDRFSLQFGAENYGDRQNARLLVSGQELMIETTMTPVDRMRLTWGASADMYLSTESSGNWTDDFRNGAKFNHTDYLVFDATGRQGTVHLTNATTQTDGGRTVSGMLVGGGEYVFTGGDLFGVRSTFAYSDVAPDLIVAGGNITFKNNVYFEGNIELLNQSVVTLSGKRAFHAEGDFVLASTAMLQIEVGDDLIRGRSVTLDGTVYLTGEPIATTHRSPIYNNMIVSDGVPLEPDRLSTLFDYTRGLLNRQAVLSDDALAMSLLYTSTPLSEFASENNFTINQSAWAEYLQEAFYNWELEDLETELMHMNNAQLDVFFALLSNSAIHAEAQRLALSNPYRAVARHFFDEEDDKPSCPKHLKRCSTHGFWFAAYQSDLQQNSDGQANGFGIARSGLHLGLDKRITSSFLIGGLFGFAEPKLHQNGNRIKANDYTLGLYARKRFLSHWEANGFIAYGDQSYRGKRMTFDGHAKSNYSGEAFFTTVELVRLVDFGNFTLTPTWALDYQQAKTHAFTEYGSQLQQTYEKNGIEQTFMRFGLNSRWKMSDRFRLDTRLQYARQIGGGDTPRIQSTLIGSSVETPMVFSGVNMGRDWLNVGVGGRWFVNDARRTAVFGNYDLDRGNRSIAHTGELGFQHVW